jgi:hypothetical protein
VRQLSFQVFSVPSDQRRTVDHPERRHPMMVAQQQQQEVVVGIAGCSALSKKGHIGATLSVSGRCTSGTIQCRIEGIRVRLARLLATMRGLQTHQQSGHRARNIHLVWESPFSYTSRTACDSFPGSHVEYQLESRTQRMFGDPNTSLDGSRRFR